MTPLLIPPKASPPGEIERSLHRQGLTLLLGVDEAGRGALCGPVFAAAVVLHPTEFPEGLNDSKLLSPAERERLCPLVCDSALAWGVGLASAEEIDTLNILQATFVAMRRAIQAALDRLGKAPEIVLVDGPLAIPGLSLPQKPLVKGDSRSLNIAAASILAKVKRDSLMDELDLTYPGYGLARHKGYGTAEHVAALKLKGMTPEHRKSFKLKSPGVQ